MRRKKAAPKTMGMFANLAAPPSLAEFKRFRREASARARRVTVQLPVDLLDRAQRSSGKSLTDTIRKGLELVAVGAVYDELRSLRGKVSFSVEWRKLRPSELMSEIYREHPDPPGLRRPPRG